LFPPERVPDSLSEYFSRSNSLIFSETSLSLN
jgi:hypothetical protein